jgi:hypothetical protein
MNDWIQKASERYRISETKRNNLSIKVERSRVAFCSYVDNGKEISWSGQKKDIDYAIILSHLTPDFFVIPIKSPPYQEFVKKARKDPRTWGSSGPDRFTLSKSSKLMWRTHNPEVTFDISKWVNDWDIFRRDASR